jgi:acetyl esterase/lipase
MMAKSTGRRRFMKGIGRGLLGAGAALQVRSVFGASEMVTPSNERDVILPGRLGNPELNLLEDPRLDPRVARAMAQMPPGGPAASLPNVTLTSTYEECLNWVSAMEDMLAAGDAAAHATSPAFADVASRKVTIKGVDGNDIDLFIEAPKSHIESESPSKLPCIVHLHGGGMSFTTAEAAQAVRWRKTLAQEGTVVVGVQFRNAGGVLGNHPFPAGLNDCASAVQWADQQRSDLGISSIVVAGESGGGNLAVAAGIKANLEGWVGAIDGVFAIAPMIFGYYSSVPPELLSWRENEGYQGTLEMTRAMSRVYDPKGAHEQNPMAWPYHASDEVLKGLPPHIITNYELDLIRDDGAVFARRLQAVGVPAISRTIDGAIHVVEIAMPDLVPELVEDTVGSLVGFARRLAE